MFRLAYTFCVFFMLAVFAGAYEFPSDIERCTHSDSGCLSRVVTNVLRTQYKGHRELDIIPFDPLHVKSMKFDKIPGSPVSVDLEFKDFDLIGMHEATVFNVTGFTKEASDMVFEIHGLYPKFIMTGPYSIDGQILCHNITGQGKATITFYDLIAIAKANCTTPERQGQRYLNIDDMQMELQPKKVTIVLENLYNGDEINQLLNDNWEVIFSELKPLLERAFAKLALYMNLTFSRVPYDDLFLQSK